MVFAVFVFGNKPGTSINIVNQDSIRPIGSSIWKKIEKQYYALSDKK